MKRWIQFTVFFLIVLSPCLFIQQADATNKFWWGSARTGGGDALDGIDGADLTAGDGALVAVDAGATTPQIYFYRVYESSASESDPLVIAPDANPGTKRWHLVNIYGRSFSGVGVDGENRLSMSNNTSRAPTASAMELYPEGNLWKLNVNGTEYLLGPIDDAATNGDTSRTWSADKIYDELALKSPLASPTFTTLVGLPATLTSAVAVTWTLMDNQTSGLSFGATGAADILKIGTLDAGPIVSVAGRLSATTYGSDGTVTDAELLYVNTLSSNAQDQLDARCLESVFGTSVGTGLTLDGTALKTHLALQSIAGLTETNGGIPYGTADNAYAWLAAGAAGKVLMGAGAAAPIWSTPTYPSASGTARTILVSNGTNNVYSTETWAVPGTSGNILKSNGTNWTSSSTLSIDTLDLTSSTSSIPWPVGTATWPTVEGQAKWDSTNNILYVGDGAAAKIVDPRVMTAVGDIIYGGTAGAPTRLAAVALGQVFTSKGVTTAPAWDSAPEITSINLGHASDTTLARVSAGVVSIEGSNILTAVTGAAIGQTMYIGTTATTINRTSAAQTLAGITLTTPDIGAATGTSLLATGIVDGLTNITISTSTPVTVGGAGKLQGVYLNQHATPATAMVYNLPVASAGQQFIVKNSHGAGGANTGVLTIHPVTSSYINYNGTNCTVSYDLVSGGAAGDYAAVVGTDATHWEVVGYKGTWTCTAP